MAGNQAMPSRVRIGAKIATSSRYRRRLWRERAGVRHVRRNEGQRATPCGRPMPNCRNGSAEVKPDVLDFRRREAELLFRRIGITFAVYGDPEAQERLIPFDVIPRILAAKEWEIAAARPRAARQGHQRLHQGRLWPPRDLAGRHRARRPGVSKSGVSPGDERPEGAARHLCPHRRHRHHAARRRHLLRARGQCAHAVRRLLHAGEPRDHAAAVSGTVLALPRRAGRELSGRTFGRR